MPIFVHNNYDSGLAQGNNPQEGKAAESIRYLVGLLQQKRAEQRDRESRAEQRRQFDESMGFNRQNRGDYLKFRQEELDARREAEVASRRQAADQFNASIEADREERFLEDLAKRELKTEASKKAKSGFRTLQQMVNTRQPSLQALTQSLMRAAAKVEALRAQGRPDTDAEVVQATRDLNTAQAARTALIQDINNTTDRFNQTFGLGTVLYVDPQTGKMALTDPELPGGPEPVSFSGAGGGPLGSLSGIAPAIMANQAGGTLRAYQPPRAGVAPSAPSRSSFFNYPTARPASTPQMPMSGIAIPRPDAPQRQAQGFIPRAGRSVADAAGSVFDYARGAAGVPGAILGTGAHNILDWLWSGYGSVPMELPESSERVLSPVDPPLFYNY